MNLYFQAQLLPSSISHQDWSLQLQPQAQTHSVSQRQANSSSLLPQLSSNLIILIGKRLNSKPQQFQVVSQSFCHNTSSSQFTSVRRSAINSVARLLSLDNVENRTFSRCLIVDCFSSTNAPSLKWATRVSPSASPKVFHKGALITKEPLAST